MRMLWLLLVAACASPPPAPGLAAPTTDAAAAVARTWLDAAVRADAAGAAGVVCPGARAAEPPAVASYTVDGVEPAWVGAEPYYRVDVTLERKGGGSERRSLAVRARDGCHARSGGPPVVGPQRLDPGEIQL
jgi:hypothetical protein